MSDSTVASSSREFDIILWGVTGFTGKLTATVFARHYGIHNPDIRIALAGRSHLRLKEVAQLMREEATKSNDSVTTDTLKTDKKIDPENIHLTLIEVKDIQHDAISLCRRTRVIIALAGPYVECGEPVLKAAAESGTDYVDITGELKWVKSMQQKYDQIAKRNRARIIPCCGFDYLLNDVGIFCVQEFAQQRNTAPVKYIHQLFVADGSKPSGGTLRTIFNTLGTIPLSQVFCGSIVDPFQFCDEQPPNEIRKKNSDIRCCRFSTLAQRWMNPHLMSPAMKQYVHWANELHCFPYSKDFIFKVGEKSDGLICAFLKTIGYMFIILTLLMVSKVQWCSHRLAAKSGEGRPTPELETKDNFVQVQTVGVIKPLDADPLKIDYTITFHKGEGYMLTAWGALETAVTCLKVQKGEYPSTNRYGFGCPSQLLGPSLIVQLESAGFDFDLKETALRGER